MGGRYGLSSKDTDTAQVVAVFENLAAEQPVNGFTIGIDDDVTVDKTDPWPSKLNQTLVEIMLQMSF